MLGHHSSRTTDDAVGRWVHLHQQEMQKSSSGQNNRPSSSNHGHRRTQSASRAPYTHTQPVESLTVSFAKLLVNQINGTPALSGPTKQRKMCKKKNPQHVNFNGSTTPAKMSIRNSKSLSQVKLVFFFFK